MRIVVGTTLVAAAFWNGFGAFHHQRSAFSTDLTGWAGFDDVFAVGII